MLAPNRLISIVGSTASGKTALALELASIFSREKDQISLEEVHLLSADSRQVYHGLENLSGADIPTGWSREESSNWPYPFFHHPQLPIFFHGLSIITPDQDWSVAHFSRLAQRLRRQLQKHDLLIVVGGTGFYHKQLWQPAATLHIAPNLKLRATLSSYRVSQLQQKLQQLDPEKLASMNQSDRHNPRRLIRALEVVLAQESDDLKINPQLTADVQQFYLHSNRLKRQAKIKARVADRFEAAAAEVTQLISRYQLPTTSPVNSTIGLQELRRYLQGHISKDQCLTQWQQREIQYATDQDTWWQKYAKGTQLTAEKPEQALKLVYQEIRSVL